MTSKKIRRSSGRVALGAQYEGVWGEFFLNFQVKMHVSMHF